jgi:hypothetical protein
LARHTSLEANIGEWKADFVAKRINSLFGSVKLTTSHPKSLYSFSDKELSEIFKDAAAVVDCSASVGVQRRLADLDSLVPVMSSYQINAGAGTVLLAEPRDRETRVDAIEVAMLTSERKHPMVNAWLNEKTDPVDIGGGCSSATAKIPDSLVKEGAGWVALTLLRWLDSMWPEKGSYGILSTSINLYPTLQTIWGHPRMVTKRGDGASWTVSVLDSVTRVISDSARSADAQEIGGVLIGSIDRQRQHFYVTEAWPAPQDSQASAVGFTRGRRKTAAKLALLESQTNNHVTYVGEWHTHPVGAGTRMSAIDSATAREMAKKLSKDRIPALCLISDGEKDDSHVVDRAAA